MRYTNPILFGDYSDPDVIRVGEDFYMTSSSFTYLPGLPILHSRDLVHWELIGYAAQRLPFARYDTPVHKCGTWAPSLRYHKGTFYIYVCLPDEGLFVYTADQPRGPWTCHFVKDVCGWIDPCPLFARDGRVWLVHALAASRCGLNNMLFVHRMSEDGLQVLDKGVLIYDGAQHGDVTVEGPKFYEREGTFWILCPAGGVEQGYQLALRSSRPDGQYEKRVVLSRGSTEVNGPHQGGWVDDGKGHDWFLHFQDVGVYGRIPHLQRVDWSDGWPMMGHGGEPELEGEIGLEPFEAAPPTSDDFQQGLGLQWQWQANPNSAWYETDGKRLRLMAVPASSLFHAGQFLSQLMQSFAFDMDVRLTLHARTGDRAGVGMMGYDYSYLALEQGRVVLVSGRARERGRFAAEFVQETETASEAWTEDTVIFRMHVQDGLVSYAFGKDEVSLKLIGKAIPMANGGWTSARPGVFCMNLCGVWGGWADLAWVHVTAR